MQVRLTSNLALHIPVVSAAIDIETETQSAVVLTRQGALDTLPRNPDPLSKPPGSAELH